MGRKRKDGDPMGLAGTRLALRYGKFWYRHRDTGRHEDVGTDLVEAKKTAARYNDPSQNYGTVAYWAPLFLSACKQRVKAKLLAQRTYDDYAGYLHLADEPDDDDSPLMIFFRKMTPEAIRPTHVQLYLDKGAEADRAVAANRERAGLSAMLSWLLRQPDCPEGLTVNPCMRRSGVQRNPESKRERYVTHDEMHEVWEVASASVRLLMSLTYRTLQRPESDIVKWTSAIVHKVGDGLELRFRQNKTKQLMHIAVAGELESLIPKPPESGNVRTLKGEPLVHRLDGHAYTYSGIAGLLQDAIDVANMRREARGRAPIPSFGFRDLKGKGATDMYYIDKLPLADIQQLLGHANQTTTEIYIKARWRKTAQPNRVNLGA